MKKISVLVAGIILIAAVAFLIINKSRTVTPISDISDMSGITSTSTPLSETEINIRDQAWEIFNQYVSSAKKHDIDGIKRVSYKLSATCEKEPQSKECGALMDNVVYFGNFMKKSALTEVLYDNNQIILTGSYKKIDQDIAVGYQRQIIYFIRDKGEVKLLSFNPADGYILQTGGTATSTSEARFPNLSKDSDRDALADVAETCSSNVVQYCFKSNPNKRDTDGNGFWDSIDLILNQK